MTHKVISPSLTIVFTDYMPKRKNKNGNIVQNIDNIQMIRCLTLKY